MDCGGWALAETILTFLVVRVDSSGNRYYIYNMSSATNNKNSEENKMTLYIYNTETMEIVETYTGKTNEECEDQAAYNHDWDECGSTYIDPQNW